MERIIIVEFTAEHKQTRRIEILYGKTWQEALINSRLLYKDWEIIKSEKITDESD